MTHPLSNKDFAELLGERDPKILKQAQERDRKYFSEPTPSEDIKPQYNAVDEYRLTPPGNAKRFIDQHGDFIRYCKKWNEWLIYDGRYWKQDDLCEIENKAKLTAISLYEDAKNEPDDKRRQEIAKWAIRSESRDNIQSMIFFARSEPGIPITPDRFDQNPWLFNVENGTTDLSTGDFLERFDFVDN